MGQVTQAVVNRWMADLRDRRLPGGAALSPHTINSYGVVVTRWLRWAERDGQLQAAPHSPRTRTDKPVREVVTDAEYRAMLEAAPVDRDRLVVQLLWETGLRASELLQLRIGDVVRHDGRWFLRVLAPRRGGGAKDSRERFVPLPRARELRRYLDGPRSRLEAASDHIFLSRRRAAGGGPYERLTVSGLEQLVHDVARDAGITRSIHPHLFRHTAGTRMLRTGMNPTLVATILGHASLDTLYQHYTHLDHRDAYDALAKVLVEEKG
jgi:integrase/recombinase XerD